MRYVRNDSQLVSKKIGKVDKKTLDGHEMDQAFEMVKSPSEHEYIDNITSESYSPYHNYVYRQFL